jgi:predicted helicase
MTFEYSAEELGLDKRISPKFLDIRRLRPLDNNQPWGIFFIAFDDTKLPVVALRRLLSKLALTKRSTSNTGEHASWNSNDLLLISQTGSNDGRSISFAHFASNPAKTDLPILKVLGWDSDDTGLKIDYVIDTLREKLVWPDDPSDSDAWRAQWREAFALKNREVIQSSKEMAERLGKLALAVRTRLREVLAIESEEGPIHKLMSVFKENLISDLDTDSFSDMYAQTIAYGLLSARIINPKANTADAAQTQIPITNPFLRDLMETFLKVGGRSHSSGVGLDFDELGINEVVDLLDNTNMEAVLRDFGDRNQKEDPVMHFFEGFLEEYDSKIRKDRGVFYTPQPVVSFIVRSVDEQLQTEFGLEDGLADTTTWGEMAARTKDLEIPEGTSPNQAFVQILDPATGTGTFPVEVIDLIYKTMTTKWQSQGNREPQIKELWNEYVPKHLLPRLHGYELMMAPYAIAHMKIGLKLYETGYRFESDERARVYLTNALEPAQDFSGTLAFAIPALSREAEAVNTIKRNHRFTVVIGNPPYSGVSSNMSDSAQELVDRYRFIDGEPLKEKKVWLQNDYVKFIAFAHRLIMSAGIGGIGYITDNSYLDGPTFRGVRYALAQTFRTIRVLDLHGSSKRRDKTDSGSADESVFDITQGVSIFLGLTGLGQKESAPCYSSLTGTREEKYAHLLKDQFTFTPVPWNPPFYIFVMSDASLQVEYDLGFRINDAFVAKGNGFMTGRDEFAIGFTRSEIESRISDFFDVSIPDAELRERYGISDYRAFRIADVRRNLSFEQSRIVKANYRPLDQRWTYFQRPIIQEWQSSAHDHIHGRQNRALCVGRAGNVVGGTWDICFCTKLVTDLNQFYRGGNVLLPIYQFPKEGELFDGPVSNFTSDFVDLLAHKLGLPLGKNQLPKGLTPEAIFHYAYAVFHSPRYRTRYADFLKIDFPRLPLAGDVELFWALAQIGSELVAIHLMEAPKLSNFISQLEGTGDFQVEKVSYSDETVWIDKAKTLGFKGVPEEVWNFHIGGYQVCQKWLKDRQAKGGKNPRPSRVLTDEDIEHYQKIVVAISETIRIMAEIDEVIEAHGGWPGAFSKN